MTAGCLVLYIIPNLVFEAMDTLKNNSPIYR